MPLAHLRKDDTAFLLNWTYLGATRANILNKHSEEKQRGTKMDHSPLHSKSTAFAPTDFSLSLFKATLPAAAASKPAAVPGGAGMAIRLCPQHKHPICPRWCRVRSGLVLVPGDSPFLFSHLPAGTLSKQQKSLTLAIFLSTKPRQSLKRKRHTHKNMRTQVPKFLQEDLMSVCFGFQCGMHALCGTRGHFPTEESIYFLKAFTLKKAPELLLLSQS